MLKPYCPSQRGFLNGAQQTFSHSACSSATRSRECRDPSFSPGARVAPGSNSTARPGKEGPQRPQKRNRWGCGVRCRYERNHPKLCPSGGQGTPQRAKGSCWEGRSSFSRPMEVIPPHKQASSRLTWAQRLCSRTAASLSLLTCLPSKNPDYPLQQWVSKGPPGPFQRPRKEI